MYFSINLEKSQIQHGNWIEISQEYYSEYENGNRTIPINHLITLAKYYNTSIDYLVGLSNEKNNLEKHKKQVNL